MLTAMTGTAVMAVRRSRLERGAFRIGDLDRFLLMIERLSKRCSGQRGDVRQKSVGEQQGEQAAHHGHDST